MRTPLSVVRLPLTVYRSSHRSEGLKGLDVGASYFVDISCAWLWDDGLKRLDVGGSALFRTFRQRQNIECEPSLIKPFQAFSTLRHTVHGHTENGQQRDEPLKAKQASDV